VDSGEAGEDTERDETAEVGSERESIPWFLM
jgi:hypothetical protein